MPCPVLLTLAFALAAPVPTETDKPKPRPRLTGTLTLPVRVDDALWLPDGKHLALRCSDQTVRVVRRDQFGEDEPTAKPVVEFKLPARCQHLALTADGTELFAVVTANGRLTVESRAYFWKVKRVLDGKDLDKPDRVIPLDTDGSSPAGVALTADGRRFVVPVVEQHTGGRQSVRFDRLSGKTGDWAGEWAKIDDPDATHTAHAFDPKTNRLFVQTQTADSTGVQSIDLTAGKQEWETRLGERPYPGFSGTLLPSPDGRLLALIQPLLVMRPVNQQLGRPPQVQQVALFVPALLNAKTGEPVELPADDAYQTHLHGFSADGRLLAGRVTNAAGVTQLVVWDTKAKRVAKGWKGYYSDAVVRFAPTGTDLLAVEREQTTEQVQTSVYSPYEGGSSGQRFTRTVHKSTLGIWDLSPLVK